MKRFERIFLNTAFGFCLPLAFFIQSANATYYGDRRDCTQLGDDRGRYRTMDSFNVTFRVTPKSLDFAYQNQCGIDFPYGITSEGLKRLDGIFRSAVASCVAMDLNGRDILISVNECGDSFSDIRPGWKTRYNDTIYYHFKTGKLEFQTVDELIKAIHKDSK